ncbi:hypothetical protein [Mycobacteroides abscessus]|nr:hypothetical protein [Mycobacteroides abscessus]
MAKTPAMVIAMFMVGISWDGIGGGLVEVGVVVVGHQAPWFCGVGI